MWDQRFDVLKNGVSRTDRALALLVFSDDETAKEICDHLAYNLRGKSWAWVESYDLFDVALSVAALYKYAPSYVDGVCIAHLVNKMLKGEVDVGGPYYDKANKIDIPTNAAVALLFSLFKSPLPNVISFLKPYISTNSQHEYLSVILAARPLDKHSAELGDYIKKILNVHSVLGRERISSRPPNKIESQVKTIIQELSPALYPAAEEIWRSIVKADNRQEITMLPRIFADSLFAERAVIPDNTCNLLGVANFFTWMAYTIYDDFIDDEGKPALLPVANLMMRRSLEAYRHITEPYPLLSKIVQRCFDDMDAANAWEIESCRFVIDGGDIIIGKLPRYGNRIVLAKRAAAHVLGPKVITHVYSNASPTQRALIEKGFIHFLIARQLNDDIHDWKLDFENGHISFVVAFLLRRLNVSPGKYEILILTKKMEDYFWKSGIDELSKLVMRHTAYARNYFAQSKLVRPNSPLFSDLLDYMDDVARKSIKNNMNHKNFYRKYIELSEP